MKSNEVKIMNDKEMKKKHYKIKYYFKNIRIIKIYFFKIIEIKIEK